MGFPALCVTYDTVCFMALIREHLQCLYLSSEIVDANVDFGRRLPSWVYIKANQYRDEGPQDHGTTLRFVEVPSMLDSVLACPLAKSLV